MRKLPANASLILVDVQNGFDDGTRTERHNPEAEANIASLIAAWRRSGRPVRHVQHDSTVTSESFFPGKPGHEFMPEARPVGGEEIFRKKVNSGFIGTGLEKHLREHEVGTVVIAGLTTNHCVSTTARMAGNLGFETFVVGDACATFPRATVSGRVRSAQEVHEAALSDLHGKFGTVIATDQAIGALE